MIPDHLQYLCSPRNGKPLKCERAEMESGRIRSGVLSDGENSWPIVDFIPRFVPEHAYWDSFSVQWAKHTKIMCGFYSGLSLYDERFAQETKWGNDLRGEIILDAGCGVGSFTRPALNTGALVIAFDPSAGVEANHRQNAQNPNLLIVQASIYDMPFPPMFERVFCFGVLQHTPDPEDAFKRLVAKLKPGGKIATDVYADVPLGIRHGLLKAKYFLRKWTAGRDPERLHGLVRHYVRTLWPFCRAIQRIPGGLCVSQHFMIDKYSDRLVGMRAEMFREYAIIEIFDMLSPSYDFPQTLMRYKQWHEEARLENIDVHYGYNGLEGRGVKAQP